MWVEISLQTFTVRRAARRALYETLASVAEAGYAGIEAARIAHDDQNTAVLRRARVNLGLRTFSAQIKYDVLRNRFAPTLRFLNNTQCRHAVVSVLPPEYLMAGGDGLRRFSQNLNELASRYQAEGIQLSYHHHDFEFLRFGKERGIDLLLRETDPTLVKWVVDTYWAQKGGKCPAAWIRQLGPRLATVHLRDYQLRRAVLHGRSADCAIGDGVLDVGAILHACQDSGVGFVSVEQDSRDPWADIRKSRKRIAQLLAAPQ